MFNETSIIENLRSNFKKTDVCWYTNANMICQQIAMRYELSVDLVSKVVATLSPYNKWIRNIDDSVNLIREYKNGGSHENVSSSTFRRNKIKAWNILCGNQVSFYNSLKTFSFYRNLLLDPLYVTIDVWYLRACGFLGHLTKKRYNIIKDITISEAKNQGIIGYQYQAMVWSNIRG